MNPKKIEFRNNKLKICTRRIRTLSSVLVNFLLEMVEKLYEWSIIGSMNLWKWAQIDRCEETENQNSFVIFSYTDKEKEKKEENGGRERKKVFNLIWVQPELVFLSLPSKKLVNFKRNIIFPKVFSFSYINSGRKTSFWESRLAAIKVRVCLIIEKGQDDDAIWSLPSIILSVREAFTKGVLSFFWIFVAGEGGNGTFFS